MTQFFKGRKVNDKNFKVPIDNGRGKLVLANTNMKLLKFSDDELTMMKSNSAKQMEREV